MNDCGSTWSEVFLIEQQIVRRVGWVRERTGCEVVISVNKIIDPLAIFLCLAK